MTYKCLFIYEGNLDRPTGTPLRLKHIINELSTNGIEITTFNNYLTKSNLENLVNEIRNNDIILLHRLDVLYKIRKFIPTNKLIIIDLHSVFHKEIPLKNLLGIILTFFKEWVSIRYLVKRKNIIISVSKSILEYYKIHEYKSSYVIQGGFLGNEIRNVKELNKIKTIGYAGNLSNYQGVDLLVKSFNIIKSIHQNVNLLIITNDSNERVKIPTLKLSPDETLTHIKKIDLLIVPRNNSKINKFSFPSKIYEYLETGNLVLISDVIETLPPNLEHFVGRFEAGNLDKLVTSIESALFSYNHSSEMRVEKLQSVIPQYTWKTQLKPIIQKALNELREI